MNLGLTVGSFTASINGSFLFEKVSAVADDPGTDGVDETAPAKIKIGIQDAGMTVAAGAVALNITDVDGLFVLYPDDAIATDTDTDGELAMKLSVGGMTITGITGLTFSVSNFFLEINNTGGTVSETFDLPDGSDDGTDPDEVTLSYTTDVLKLGGTVSLGVAVGGFAGTVSGSFSFEKVAAVADDVLTLDVDETAPAKMKIAIQNAAMNITVGSVVFNTSGINGLFVVYGSGTASGKMAMQLDIATVSLTGIPGISLAVSDFFLKLNTAGDIAAETFTVPDDGDTTDADALPDSVTMDYAADVTQFGGTMILKIGGTSTNPYLTLTATNAVVDTLATGTNYVVSFASVSGTFTAGTFSVTATASNFGISAQGKFKTGTAANPTASFSVSLGITGADGGDFQWPPWLPIQVSALSLTWDDLENSPGDFQLEVTATITGFFGKGSGDGLQVSGSVQDLVIDIGLLAAGEYPIVSIGGIAGSIKGSLFGMEIEVGLIAEIVEIDTTTYLEATSSTAPENIEKVFFLGLLGGFKIAGVDGMSMRLAFSERGPLAFYVESNVPILLDPVTGLTLDGLSGGVEFSTTIPTPADAFALRSDAFASVGELDAAAWRDRLVGQIGQQIEDNVSFTNPAAIFESPMVITAGAELYTAYASKLTFRAEVTLKIDTTGKVLINAAAVYGNSLDARTFLYADLTQIQSGAGRFVLLVDLPEKVGVVDPPLSIFGEISFEFIQTLDGTELTTAQLQALKLTDLRTDTYTVGSTATDTVTFTLDEAVSTRFTTLAVKVNGTTFTAGTDGTVSYNATTRAITITKASGTFAAASAITVSYKVDWVGAANASDSFTLTTGAGTANFTLEEAVSTRQNAIVVKVDGVVFTPGTHGTVSYNTSTRAITITKTTGSFADGAVFTFNYTVDVTVVTNTFTASSGEQLQVLALGTVPVITSVDATAANVATQIGLVVKSGTTTLTYGTDYTLNTTTWNVNLVSAIDGPASVTVSYTPFKTYASGAPTAAETAFKITLSGGARYSLPGNLSATVSGMVVLQFSSTEFRVQFSAEMSISLVGQIGVAAGEFVIQDVDPTAAKDYRIWGAVQLDAGEGLNTYLQDMGITVDGTARLSINTSDTEKTVNLRFPLPGAVAPFTDAELSTPAVAVVIKAESFTFYLQTIATFKAPSSDAQLFSLDGTFYMEVTPTRLEVFATGTLKLGPAGSELATFTATALFIVESDPDGTGPQTAGMGGRFILSITSSQIDGVTFAAAFHLTFNTTGRALEFQIPDLPSGVTAIPTITGPAMPFSVADPTATASYETYTDLDGDNQRDTDGTEPRKIVIPAGAPPAGFTTPANWTPTTTGFYFYVFGAGTISLGGKFDLVGAFEIRATDTVSGLTFRLDFNMSLNVQPLGSLSAAGTLAISSAGVLASVELNASATLGSAIQFSGRFFLEINTTSSAGNVSRIAMGTDNLPTGSTVQVSVAANTVRLFASVNVSVANVMGGRGSFLFEKVGSDITVTFNGQLTVKAGSTDLLGFSASGGFQITSAGFVGVLDMSLTANIPGGFGFSLAVTSARFELNNTGSTVSFGTFGNVAAGFKVSITGSMTVLALTMSGSFTLTVSTSEVSVSLAANMSVFGAVMNISGTATIYSGSNAGFVLDLQLRVGATGTNTNLNFSPVADVFNITGSMTLKINTTNITRGGIAANSVTIGGSVSANIMGFSLSGAVYITVSSAGFSIVIPSNQALTLDFFGFFNLSFYGSLNTDSSFSFTASASVTFLNPDIFGFAGNVSFSFSKTASGTATVSGSINATFGAFGIKLSAGGNFSFSSDGTVSLSVYISLQITPAFTIKIWTFWKTYYIHVPALVIGGTWSKTFGTRGPVPAPPPPPTLARLDGNTLYLNVGADAVYRGAVYPAGDESYTLTSLGDGTSLGKKVRVNALGYDQDFDNVTKIVTTDTQSYNTFIAIDDALALPVDINLGKNVTGENHFIVGSGVANVQGGSGKDWVEFGAAGGTYYGGTGTGKVEDHANGNTTVRAPGHADYILADDSLTYGNGTTTAYVITFVNDSVKKVILDGAAGATYSTSSLAGVDANDNNSPIAANPWTGTATFNGSGSGSTVQATTSGDITLTNSGITENSRTITLSNITNTELYGDEDANVFNVSGWTSSGSIDGKGGADTVVATNDANFTLSDTALTRSSGGTLALTSVEVATLTGGASANTFTVSSWTGSAALAGAGGNDAYTVNLHTGTAGSVSISDASGAGDTLVVNGTASADTLTVTGTSVSRGSQTISYSGIETLTINAGDGDDAITINSASVATTIYGDAGADTFTANGNAASLTLSGGAGNDAVTVTATAAALTVNGDADDDTVNLRAVGAATTVNTGLGTNTINLGSTGSILDGLVGALTINGGGTDTVNLNDAGSGAKTGQLTGTTITGLGMAGGITYSSVEILGLTFGSGDDTFTIISTHVGTTTVNTGAGADRVNVRTIAGVTTINAGAGADNVYVGTNAGNGDTNGNVNSIGANLTVNGDANGGTLHVDDSGDTSSNGSLTATVLSSLGMTGTLTYGTLTTLNIHLGSAGDTFTIESTHAGTTNLNTNGGNDTINVRTIAGATNINTGANTNIVNVGSTAGAGGAGNVNAIAALLTLTGGGTDTVNVDDTADTVGNIGTLTAAALTGLGMTSGISYSSIETLNLELGAGGDTLDIVSTSALTNVDGNAGDDVITANSNHTVGTSPIGATLNLDGNEGSDHFHIWFAGAGSSLINVRDSGTTGTNNLTLNGTPGADTFLLRKHFVVLLQYDADDVQQSTYERVNYNEFPGGTITNYINGTLTLNPLGGANHFAIDDNSSITVINGGNDGDTFQIAQVFGNSFTGEGFETGDLLATTRGLLSHGVSKKLTINGGTGEDYFIIFHNRAVLDLDGGDGNDTFTIRAFALAGSSEGPEDYDPERGSTNVATGGGANHVSYAVNAPVSIDGGSGTDTIVAIATEFSDTIILTPTGIYGMGLNVTFTNIERLAIYAAEGNDHIWILGAPNGLEVEVVGGLGSDTIHLGGAPDPVQVIRVDTDGNPVLDVNGDPILDTVNFTPVYQLTAIDSFITIVGGVGGGVPPLEAGIGLPGENTGPLPDIGNVNLLVDEDLTVDRLWVRNEGSTVANTGTLTSTRLSGLGMTTSGGSEGYVDYSDLDEFVINLGSGDDTFTIENTGSGRTVVDGGGGADTFNARTISGHTIILGQAGNDTFNVGSTTDTTGVLTNLDAHLTLDGGADTDVVNANHQGDLDGNTGLLTRTTLTGLEMTADVATVNQAVSFRVDATAGTFRLGYEGNWTAALAWNATDDDITGALWALFRTHFTAEQTTVHGNATTGAALGSIYGNRSAFAERVGDEFILNFQGALAGVAVTLNVDTAALTGTITTTQRIAGLNYYGIDTFNVSLGSGADTLTVETTHTGTTTVNTNSGADRVNVRTIAGVTTINTGAGADNVYVGTNAGNGDTAGNVNSIGANLTVNGDADGGTLHVDDTGDTLGNNGNLTSTVLSDLGMTGTLTYGTLTTANIHLGAGGDTFTIESTHGGTTNLNANAGNDTIHVRTVAGATNITTGTDTNIVNVGSTAGGGGAGNVNAIAALLTLTGGGTDTVNVDDTADTAGNTDGNLTATRLTGLGMGTSASNGITYSDIEILNLNLGSGGDIVRIESTHTGTTNLNANAGNDTINVRTITGATNIHTGTDTNVVNVGSQMPTTGGNVNGIAALLTLTGGGTDTVNVDDTLDTAGNTDGNLTSTRLTGLGMGTSASNGITYASIEALVISLGSGADIFTIETTHVGTTTVNGTGGADRVNVRTIAGVTTINAGAGLDNVYVGTNAGLGDTAGNVDGIGANLYVYGEADQAYLHVDDTGDDNDNTGNLTSTVLSGLDMGGVITYGTLHTANIHLGTGADEFTIVSTHAGITNLNTNNGDDTVHIRTTAGLTNVTTGTGTNIVNIGSLVPTLLGTVNAISSLGLLTLDGGGTDTVNVDDTGDADDNIGNLTSTLLTGLNMANGVEYAGIETLNINLGSGSDTFRIESTHVGTTNLNANAGNDTINVRTIDGATNIHTGTDTNVVNVGSLMPTTGGNVNAISALLTITGGGTDTVNVDDRSDTAGNTGTLTGSTIRGLGMASGIDYTSVETLNIDLGSGDDVFNVQGTTAVTNLTTHDGDDRIYVSSAASLTTGTSTDFLTGHLDLIFGELNLFADSGRNLLMVSDEAATAGDSAIAITSSSISGMAPAIITFQAAASDGDFTQGVTIWTSRGHDVVVLTGSDTRTGTRTVTTLNTNTGDDNVTVTLDASVDGFFVLNTEDGDDTVDASASTLPLVIFGGDGLDTIQGGSGGDIIFGDRGRVHYLDANGDAVTVLGGGGPGDLTDGVIRDDLFAFTVDASVGAGESITGGSGSDLIFGGFGGDTITAGEGDNVVIGDHAEVTVTDGLPALLTSLLDGGGDDVITAGAGHDLVLGGTGLDTINAGAGNNVLLGDHGTITLSAGILTDIDTMVSLDGDVDTLTTLGGRDYILGGEAGDTIDAGDGDNAVAGDHGTFEVTSLTAHSFTATDFTTGGNDDITTGSGDDTVVGGFGTDTIVAGDGDNVVLGDHGDLSRDSAVDDVTATSTDEGTGDDDIITTGSGLDVILGGMNSLLGNDTLTAGEGVNFIFGDSGTLTVEGGLPVSLATTASTFGGADIIDSGDGDDYILGGEGADFITAAHGNNLVFGDTGSATFSGSLTVNLEATSDAGALDQIFTGMGNDFIFGGRGDDLIDAGEGDNVAFGDQGEVDFTAGHATSLVSADATDDGHDTIFTASGSDVVLGGGGSDLLTVGVGPFGFGEGANTVVGDHGTILRALNGTVLTTTRVTSGDLDIGGDDVITGGFDDDVVIAGAGFDAVNVGEGNNVVLGDEGRIETDSFLFTVIESSSGDYMDLIIAGAGSGTDYILGGGSADTLIAGDILFPGDGTNVVLGDHGTITFSAGVLSQVVSTTSTGDDDWIEAGDGFNLVIGGFGFDTITTLGGTNVLIGDQGRINVTGTTLVDATTLDAGTGFSDMILTGDGTHWILGGDGDDVLTADDPFTVDSGYAVVLGDHGQIERGSGDAITVTSLDMTVGGADLITTGGGDDIIVGGLAADLIDAGEGDNLVLGDSGEIVIAADGGYDLARSLAPADGDSDLITTGAGNDLIIGGAGGDVITAGEGNNLVLGDIGTLDFIAGILRSALSSDFTVGGDDIITTGDGDDFIIGGVGADLLTAGEGDNVVLGDHGEVTYTAAAAYDLARTLEASAGDIDTITAGAGDDLILGGAADDSITAGDGNNLVLGDHGSLDFDEGLLRSAISTDFAVGGDDTITAGAGNDFIIGGLGADSLTAGEGDNVVLGDHGEVTYTAAGEYDLARTLEASAGAVDTITAGAGDDLILGGAAGDSITAGDGANLVIGDHGTLDFDAGLLRSAISTDFAIGGDDTITAGAGKDFIIGGLGADSLTAGEGDNVVLGDHGEVTYTSAGEYDLARTLEASAGAVDTITAGAGDDLILGGAAGDSITAGDGANLVIGDHGSLDFDAGLLRSAISTDFAVGGDDTVTAGAGNDFIIGGLGADSLTAGEGDNLVLGDHGEVNYTAAGKYDLARSLEATYGANDAITAGGGNDLIIGGAATDTIAAGDGNNLVIGDHGTLDFDEGLLRSAISTDFAIGGDDTITAGAGADFIIGGLGADTITAGAGDNVVLGDHGEVTYTAAGKYDLARTLEATAGAADTISAGSGHDLILGGAAGDEIAAGDGNNLVIGDHGSLDFDAGLLRSAISTDFAVGGNDTITAGAGNDFVIGGLGTDSLTAGEGANVVLGDHGEVTYTAAGRYDLARSLEATYGANDSITTGGGNDLIIGGAATDTIAAGNGNNLVIGDHGTLDFVEGDLRSAVSTDFAIGGDDTITTGAGDDFIIGGLGADSLTAGEGDNVVLGDHGEVVYTVAGEYDLARTLEATAGAADTISAGAGNDLILGGAAGDEVSAGNGNNLVIGDHGTLDFDEGLLRSAISTDFAVGGNDTITAGAGNDFIIGGLGTDSLTAGEGDNVVLGDHGEVFYTAAGRYDLARSLEATYGANDSITTGGGNDLIIGGAATDTIAAGNGDNLVIGDHGTLDFVEGDLRSATSTDFTVGGNDTITAGAGNDFIIGGLGADSLTAGEGDNLVLGDHGELVFSAAGDLDRAKSLSPTEGAGDTISTGAGRDIVIGGRDADTITAGDGDNVVFGDNGEATWLVAVPVRFTTLSTENSADDEITTGAGNDVILAGAGADLITAGNGDNTVFADEGELEYDAAGILEHLLSLDSDSGANDTVSTGSGNDIVVGGTDTDTITAGDGDNLVFGDNGNAEWLAGVPVYFGSFDPAYADDDIIATGSGDDVILAGAGADTVTAGDGDNTIFADEGELSYDAAGRLEVALSLATAQGADDTVTSGSGHDIVFGGTDTDTITAGDGDNLIFGDTGRAEWLASVPVYFGSFDPAYANDDTISTGSGDDVILAGAGADTVTAGDGDNTIFADEGELEYDAGGILEVALSLATDLGADDSVTSGSGDDVVFGGTDTDAIAAGDGNNLIFGDIGRAEWLAGVPVYFGSFDPDYANDDTISSGSGDDVILAGAGADTVTAGDGDNTIFADEGELSYDAAGLLEVALSLATDLGAADVVTSGAGNDIVFGGIDTDTITAGDGDNLVFGDIGTAEWLAGVPVYFGSFDPELANDDTISTGSGDDVILAGAGADTITAGDGNNTIFADEGELTYDAAGLLAEALSLAPDLGADDTVTSGSGDDLILGGFDRDSIDAGNGNNVIFGDNGTAVYSGGLAVLFQTLTPENSNNDTIASGAGRDVILAGDGTDVINAGDGDNIVLGDEGEITLTAGVPDEITSTDVTAGAADTITSGSGSDIIIGGHGADTIAAGEGNNIVAGDNAVLTLTSGAAIKLVVLAPATGGVDTITAGAGRDVIVGGTAGDTINAGNGDNVVAGDQATITFNSGTFATLTPTTPEIGGVDTITTGSGNDRIVAGTAADWIDAGDGHNVVIGDHATIIQELGALTLVESTAFADGGIDLIFTGSGNDIVLAGTGGDTVHAGAGNDLVFGDHARVAGAVDLALLPLAMADKPFTYTSISTQNLGADGRSVAGDDVIFADAGDDIVFGQQGDDILFGGDGDDDLIGGHNVALGQDGADVIDAGAGFDLVAGDNASVLRTGSNISPRARVLAGTAMFDDRGTFLGLDTPQAWPTDVPERAIVILDHANDTTADLHGADTLIGGAGNDVLFGQLSNDFIHGDATLPVEVATAGTIDRAAVRATAAALFSTDLWVGADSDGDDYIEGNGGDDLIYGGLGQDDIVGGSSSMFGLTERSQRPDGSDTIYGGNGTAADFEDAGDASLNGRARDADVILGDNANIFRLVGLNGVSAGAFLTFSYDSAGTQRIIVRAFELLDYTVPASLDDIGGADEIYGEAGDDSLHGQVGEDELQGNGNDDNLYGGQGDDNIFGGAGDDAISHSDELKPPPAAPGNSAADPGKAEDGETALVGDDPLLARFVAPPSNLPVALRGGSTSSASTAAFFSEIFLGLDNDGGSWLAAGGDAVFADGDSKWRIFTQGVVASSDYGVPSNLVGPMPAAAQYDQLLQDTGVTPPADTGLPAAPAAEVPETPATPSDEETPSGAAPAAPAETTEPTTEGESTTPAEENTTESPAE